MSAWGCIDQARRHDAGARLPLELLTPSGWLRVGSLSRQLIPVLDRIRAGLPQGDRFLLGHDAIRLHLTDAQARSELLGQVHESLKAQGFLPGWRGELYRISTSLEGEALALVERASARWWGLLTFGAHCNGYVAGPDGRPTHLWIAQRSSLKATDPGMLDNLVGCGVRWDETPLQSLKREVWEEAGLTPDQAAGLIPAGACTVLRDVPDGLQREQLHLFDLQVDPDVTPVNQDGEVAEFQRLPVHEAIALAAEGRMTVDAALATLDFALRHRLLPPSVLRQLSSRMAALRTPV